MDDLCCTAGSLDTRNGQLLYAGRVHPCAAGRGLGCHGDSDHSGAKARLKGGSMNSFYEPRENIAGAAHRINRAVNLRDIQTHRARVSDEIQVPGFMQSLETWARNNPGTAVVLAVISALFLYEMYIQV
jgi:hypothetical protein